MEYRVNPILEKEKQVIRPVSPFRIVCVFEEYEGYDFPILQNVREYALQNKMVFSGRPYNYKKYKEDERIERLPAFHLYYNGGIDETYSFDKNPIAGFQKILYRYEENSKKKELLQQARKARLDRTLVYLKQFLHLRSKE